MPLFFAMLIFLFPSMLAAFLAGISIEKKRYVDAVLAAWFSISMIIFAAGYQIVRAIEAIP